MPKARAVEAFVVWMLSIMLAGIFLLAGVPKLIGIETIGLQAAAMHGFPTWIRVLAGLVEVVGAICLLLPRVAWFAALLLAFVMIPATLTQYTSGEPGVYLPIIVFLALVFLAWRRSAKEVNDSYQQFVKTPHPLLYEGVIAGLIGASLIAVWFLFVDSIARRPFYTPEVLGRALVGVLGPSTQEDSAITFVLAYTVFHFSAFMVVGLIASLIVSIARKEPSILFFFLILFVMTEVGVYGLVGLLDVGTELGKHAWIQIMIGNLLATVGMGYYFWRMHGELADEFRHSLDWERPPESWDSRPTTPPQATGAGLTGRNDAPGSKPR